MAGSGSVSEPSSIRVSGDIAEVSIGEGQYAVVDATDEPRVKGFYWRLNDKGEPYTSYPDPDFPKIHTTVTMKMMIVGVRAGRGQAIKNLDGNPLNCRRSNVKLMTLSEARALDKKNLGPVVRKPRVVKNSIRRTLGMMAEPRPEPTFKRRVLDEPAFLVQSNVPASVVDRLKAVCKGDKRSISDVVSEAISDWLERRGPGP